ncbi:gamma-aminobutyric acid type B receptor subunit 2 [Drosophila mojavensis]|uniref:Gamma-aminobutyric acid type B receptor subunit 2 n=1 Tax=Drosophila mojavensis TaxID=7230 RepID=B4KF86_DROMO|nr:gamma-aminobutyric acid type B receptor subunit 2 [Drosophila mojavensis]XP_015021273.1 gamma-aminobutyric acid type B receptor subunit 2 [Drosophila mojavensis]XP_015021274.1 gamma-aminobutyric acid type B receptor subunit 2 [Drosophila mojavensis]XP_032584855.1 gamma-aminobutyric acid type B receptor subunit 2 [Drosophila mojavensis]XP_043864624.1 gamma-aminobutyric acid type B receptor subunit 2 [Drosophila mojavensis]XP_043864625.1 gamma-aminobutyric acid type B receptor subunit 2 [Dros
MAILPNGMRIIHGSPTSHRLPMLAMLLALALASCSRDAAGMESSAELQVLRTLQPVPSVSSVQSLETLPGVAIESYAPTLADRWRSKRRKVKRRHRLNSQSNLPTITANAGMGANLSSWQQQRYLKVNQVFESERRMSHAEIQRNHGKIVLLGLFELSTKRGPRPDGLSELGAATMAIEHINRKQLLPGYTLELVTNDTQCDPGVGVDRFFHAIYTQPSTRMMMLLGSACSEVTESLAKVVPYWNIVQVSFGSTSPALSDRREFPYFYRTVAPDSSHNPARIAFIRRFGWGTVTTFSQNEEVHSLAVNNLVTELEAANISCAATITFAATDFKEQLLLLRETDTRIIIGSFSQELAPQILCEAYRLRMFGADYAWILHESMGAPWWTDQQTPCTRHELQLAVENLIVVSTHNSIVGNNVSYSGLNNHMFNSQLRKQFEQFHQQDAADVSGSSGSNTRGRKRAPQTDLRSRQRRGTVSHHLPDAISRYAPQTYDAVWAIALALRAAETHWRQNAAQSKLDGFDYTRSDMAWEFLQQLGKLHFLGVSGPVSFSGPDRVGTTAFYQIQRGLLEPIALYYPATDALDFRCPRCRPVKWHSGQVPIAKRVFKMRVATIAPLAFYTIATLSSVGIALAIAFLAFNLHFRKLKAIKLSSPKLSNITAVGCIFVYATVILLGLDHSTLPSAADSFATVCTARVYLLSAGFSLAFGSMFAKTYRVHRIFTRTGSVFKDKMLQDIQLILLVCGLLLVDALLVTLWVVADPMERHLHNLTLEISAIDRSVVYQPQVEVCRSQHTQTWLGVLYAYKGLLLVVGVYMAWETRHVKIAALNDSQYIGVSVYSVVITSAIVVVLANLISERVTLAFITITALILASTTATLCLLFIPKLHDIWARNDIIDPVIHSMGLKMECNTRRFVVDDRRELQYRVEVQNRVYKKEIQALDAEIRKLERMLESGLGNGSTTTSSSTSLLAGHGHLKPELTVTSNVSQQAPLASSNNKSRTPSISGILPNLLLSVLPPVIPRASWPSAEYMQIPMRRSVTFASQPQLEEACLPTQDLINLRLAHQQATEAKTGLINRLRGIFSRTTSSNKGSTASLADQKGLKAAFKSHMGLFTRLIPSSQTASCNAIYSNANPLGLEGASLAVEGGTNGTNLKPIHRGSLTKSGTHLDHLTKDPNFLPIPTIYGESFDLQPNEPSAVVGGKYVKLPETKVNFQLPSSRRPSLVQPTAPSLRERVRGSPRFPHRILPPTCSLSALAEAEDRVGSEASTLAGSCKSIPRISLQHATSGGTWKSMETAAKSRLSLDSQEDAPPTTAMAATNGLD